MYKRAAWTESFVQWSPYGNYLATVHRQGVVIWGGASWQRLARFSHPGVRLAPRQRHPCLCYPATCLASCDDGPALESLLLSSSWSRSINSHMGNSLMR